MSPTSTTLFPFLYPSLPTRLIPRLLTLSNPTRRFKKSLTPAAARLLLADELESTTTSPTSDPAAPPIPTDHRTPPFLDTLTLTLHSGDGGNGCVSFLREKFISHGPANGGDGGSGGDVYITVDEQLSSLHKLSRMKVVKAGRGMNGMGGSMNGRNGEDVLVKVPWGTVVRVLEKGEGGILPSQKLREMEEYGGMYPEEYEAEEAAEDEHVGEVEDEVIVKGGKGQLREEDVENITQRKRRGRFPRRFAKSNINDPESDWVHYPLSLAANLNSPHWPPQKPVRREVVQPDVLKLDFSGEDPASPDNSLGLPVESGSSMNTGYGERLKKQMEPVLLLKGGAGGYGNPNFITKENRRPMWATKGAKGSVMKIQLELKLLADVGLVGRPNVGKSSLLRCVTGSRARVGNWAFTTLKPNMGTVVLDKGVGMADEDGSGSGGRERFTIADIPGLVKDAGDNRGLGWDFLRHVERARGLVFVVDLGFDPVRQVEGLWKDIREYEKMRQVEREKAEEVEKEMMEAEKAKREEEGEGGTIIKFEEDTASEAKPEEGISSKPWMVVANKADLEGAERRFNRLQQYLDSLRAEPKVTRPIGCMAVSALRAGLWDEGEYEREEEMWKGVIAWFRNLAN